jgi:hypothetical protein
MEVDGHDRAVKAGKFVDTVGDKEIKKAGLADRSCGNQ